MTPLDIDRVRRALPEKRIEYYRTVDSTMNAAARLEPGAAVVAEEQTAGRGRHGHSWHSEPGNGIYCSMVLAPSPALTLALGLAAQNAIFEATGLHCDLRWPNDLMLGGKKVGGVLAQGIDGRAIAGIGINVNHTSFPPELAGEAMSLREWPPRRGAEAGDCEGTGWRAKAPAPQADESFDSKVGQTLSSVRAAVQPVSSQLSRPALSREDILIALLRAVDLYAALPQGDILRLFTHSSSYARGRHVVVQQSDGVIEGVTAGLDPAGFLIVRRDDGTDTLILAGGVRAAGS
jgi:BirA family biotin operon repressor/biotin-[acetyl-CoA-carboxylase] ligase